MSETETKYHTIAHLILSALHELYDSSVNCMGCNMSDERLRFDFSLDHKLDESEKENLVNKVNEYIDMSLPVSKLETSLEEARNSGAHGDFNSKYGQTVFVYKIGDISNEICGGPHVENTSELSHIKIIKEESSSAGVRRIKVVMIK